MRQELGPEHALEWTTDLGELVRRAQRSAFDVAVLDPGDLDSICSGDDPEGQFRAFYRRLGLPVVLLTPASLGALQWVAMAAHNAWIHVALRTSTALAVGCRAAIERAAAGALGIRVLDAICASLPRPLSRDAACLLGHLFQEPALYRTEKEVGRPLDVRIRRLNRELAGAGLRRFRVLRRAARVALVFNLVRNFNYGLKQASHAAGIDSRNALIEEVSKLTGLTPGRLCAVLDEATLVGICVRAARDHFDTTNSRSA